MKLGVIALVALPACTTVEDRRTVEEEPVELYRVEQDVETQPGQHFVEARATCDAGDQVLGGGCSWGAPLDPQDHPLRPVIEAPDGEAFVCVGQNTGVGRRLKTVRAAAVCVARGAS